MEIRWSEEVAFAPSAVGNDIPDSPGIYEILQNLPYQRYRGQTRILKIGETDTSLRAEVGNHFARHAVANRLARVRNGSGVRVSVVFATLSREQAGQAEAELLRTFEDEHWDLPVLNSQRGYARGTDAHFRGST